MFHSFIRGPIIAKVRPTATGIQERGHTRLRPRNARIRVLEREPERPRLINGTGKPEIQQTINRALSGLPSVWNQSRRSAPCVVKNPSRPIVGLGGFQGVVPDYWPAGRAR